MNLGEEGKEVEGKDCWEADTAVEDKDSKEVDKEAGIDKDLWGRQGYKVLKVANKYLHMLDQSHIIASRKGKGIEASTSRMS